MTTKRICILDKALPLNEEFYDKLVSNLKAQDITITYCRRPNEDSENADIIILAAPMNTKIFAPHQIVLGLRWNNRKERLLIADKIMSPKFMARWASPESNEELKETLAEWNTDEYVFKYDSSAGRRGVALINQKTEQIPEDYSSEKDIIMEYLSDDPYTYKADMFCGVLLNSWFLRTTDINHEEFNNYTKNPTKYDLPADVKMELEELSRELMKYGGGYVSIDLMKFNGHYKIIEINTNTVGRNISWKHFSEDYLVTYPAGIKELLETSASAPNFEKLWSKFRTKDWIKSI
jgi:glutathione synthase/RimK-type ligase-like ATP-grasp enzyme